MLESTFPAIGTSISSSRASLGNASLPAINDTRSSQQKTYSMEIGVLSPLPCRATQVRKQEKRLPTKKRRRKSSPHWKMRASSMRHTSSLSLPQECGGASAAPCNGGTLIGAALHPHLPQCCENHRVTRSSSRSQRPVPATGMSTSLLKWKVSCVNINGNASTSLRPTTNES